MAADISASLKDWSTTEASNSPSGSTSISTNLDDNLRAIQAAVRDLAATATVASATTADIGANDATFITISGTTTITGFGTVSAGIYKWLVFSDALTLTHNGTSLILPTSANITTTANDTALMLSLGSGNWRCLAYQRANGSSVIGGTGMEDGTVGSPGLKFNNDADTGFYRIGANSLGIAAGGLAFASFGQESITFTGKSRTGTNEVGGSITGTAGAATGSLGQGGPITFTAGAASSIATTGGAASLIAGAGVSQGGAAALTGGAASSGTGGAVTLTSGNGTTAAGNITLTAGTTTASGTGGSIVLVAGNSGGGNAAGSVCLRSAVAGGGADNGVVSLENSVGTPAFQFRPGLAHRLFKTNSGNYHPAISSGAGSGASIQGNDSFFVITCGTTASATIVVNFDSTWVSAPHAIAQNASALVNARATCTTTQCTIVLSAAPSNTDRIVVWVAAIEA